MTEAPQRIDKLEGTHWTRLQSEDGYRHFSVAALSKKAGIATLSPVLGGPDIELPWRDLRNREEWVPGWQR